MSSKYDRYRVCVACYLIPIKVVSNEILLIERIHTGYYDGYYSLIAGHLEDGETVIECMIRETEEEGGVVLLEKNIKFACVVYRPPEDENDDGYVDLYFYVTKWSGDFVNKEPDKHGSFVWFRPNRLPDNVVPEVRAAIKDFFTSYNIFSTYNRSGQVNDTIERDYYVTQEFISGEVIS